MQKTLSKRQTPSPKRLSLPSKFFHRHSRIAMELVILIGLQASGKSTFRGQTFDKTHQVVSKDLMGRKSKNRETRQRRLVSEILSLDQNVVVDNTNPSVASRAFLLELGRAHKATCIAYYFKSDFRACLERNRNRLEKVVPYPAIVGTSRDLVAPSFEEGFNKIFHVSLVENAAFQVVEL